MEKKLSNLDAQPKIIKTENEFWAEIQNSKNDISQLFGLVYRDDVGIEELKEANAKATYPSFGEYLKKHNLVLSEELQNNPYVQYMQKIHANLTERIKNFETKAQALQILEEAQEFFRSFSLGITKKE